MSSCSRAAWISLPLDPDGLPDGVQACRARQGDPHVHTFASRLAMTGAHPRTIQELRGWSELAMVERYANLSASHKAEAVERLALAEISQRYSQHRLGAKRRCQVNCCRSREPP